ncbi:MAG: hypothetical protein EOO38_07010 [Cytophagaceae bacterium]|nr:MAG: hypothetical protein EOO38_07010 [Cytophagaceae bacterium]
MKNTSFIPISAPTDDERAAFTARSYAQGACLLFKVCNRATGYGTFIWRGRAHGAHRLALAWDTGGFHRELYALHSCGVKNCVALGHLRWGTQKENIAEALVMGAMQRGEKHHNALYSDAQISYVWACWYTKKMKVSDICAETKMNDEYVRQIIRREIRTDLTSQLVGTVRREVREANCFGEGRHNSKLNDKAVRRIRRLKKSGLLSNGEQVAIAKELGCTVRQIIRAARGESWKHVK